VQIQGHIEKAKWWQQQIKFNDTINNSHHKKCGMIFSFDIHFQNS
jgi:predicted nucleic acid-binding protein